MGVIFKNVEIGEIHLIPSAKDNSYYFNTEDDDWKENMLNLLFKY